MRIARNVRIESARAFGRIDHEEHDVRIFNIFARENDREFFGHQTRLALASDSRRIDKANVAPVIADHLIDRIARRSRNRRNDRPIFPNQLVQQRRLADVRMPNDRNPDFMRLFGRGHLRLAIFAFLCVLRGLSVLGS